MQHDYQRVEAAIRFLDDNAQAQPSLQQVADHVGLSPYHFQRLFSRWAGVSPKRFLQSVTLQHAKHLLRDSASVLDTSLEAGLSGPSRLHDLFVAVEAVTPGQFKAGGEGLTLRWGLAETPFGECLLAWGTRGICSLDFVDGDPEAARQRLRDRWPRALLEHDPQGAGALLAQVFRAPRGAGDSLHVWLRGTNHQLRVWKALLRIPPGRAVSYGDVATALGAPGAARAIGTALANNPVAVLIPCHRVLRASGAFGEYRWGAARKRALLGWEAANAVGAQAASA